jgi:hypothetical protein
MDEAAPQGALSAGIFEWQMRHFISCLKFMAGRRD